MMQTLKKIQAKNNNQYNWTQKPRKGHPSYDRDIAF
jgi:hypothetical protein